MSINQVELSTGTWPISEIRPDEWADFFIMHSVPERPYIPKEVLGGEVERITPPDDSLLWDPYNNAMRTHNQQYRHYWMLFGFSTVEVPADWELPAGKALALGSTDDPRTHKLRYIKYHILASDEDVVVAQAATNGIVTKEERAAGGAKFPSADGDEAGDVGSAGPDSAGTTQD